MKWFGHPFSSHAIQSDIKFTLRSEAGVFMQMHFSGIIIVHAGPSFFGSANSCAFPLSTPILHHLTTLNQSISRNW